MLLSRIAAEVRPRAPWEAVDHGFGLTRRFARQLFPPWLAVLTAGWLLVILPLHAHPGWAFALLWWLRPLFDRVPLFVLSRALFGAPPSLREVLKALPGLLRGHLVSALVLFRLSPVRSFLLPVWELEGLRGSQRWRRSSLLQREDRGTATLLTAGSSLLEMVLVLGAATAVEFLFPERQPFSSGEEQVAELLGGLDLSNADLFGLLAATYLAHALIEPFYVSGGFALYLNRRTSLEGWDIAIGFGRLTERLSRAGLAGLLAAFLLPSGLRAETAPSGAPAPGTPEMTIRQVYEAKELQTKRTVTHWKSKKAGEERPSPRLFDDLHLSPLASAARPVLALTLLALFVALALRLVRDTRRERGAGPEEARAASPPPRVSTLGEAEPLPREVPVRARSLWTEGRREEALGLLYRASIARLAESGLPISPSSTEGECLSALRRAAPGALRTAYLADLVAAWQTLAYAHRRVDEAVGLGLCAGFARAFPAGPQVPP
ncbi:MAG: DUF4129 domain-containing protein [Holophagales bacterium]|nr:DUF4129 domain-containing protein [Holophagales bacterium]MBK9965583.1 DUF4129 domain-containing protein [Holophagales bacterium]